MNTRLHGYQYPLPPDQAYNALMRLAASEVAHPSTHVFGGIDVKIDWQHKTCVLDDGGWKEEELGLSHWDSAEDPYAYVLEMLIGINATRAAYAAGLPNETFWKEDLAKSESIVRLFVADIYAYQMKASSRTGSHAKAANDRPSPNLQDVISERRKQFWHSEQALDRDLVAWCQANGFEFRFVGPYRSISPYEVAISTDPVGGTVRCIKELPYRIAVALKKPRDQWPWVAVSASKAKLIGTYRVFVNWGHGVYFEDTIDVESSSPLVFRPTRR